LILSKFFSNKCIAFGFLDNSFQSILSKYFSNKCITFGFEDKFAQLSLSKFFSNKYTASGFQDKPNKLILVILSSFFSKRQVDFVFPDKTFQFRLFISIFSWVSVVIGIALIIVLLIQDFFQNTKIFKNEPPKWL
jgi:hypothetical protein